MRSGGPPLKNWRNIIADGCAYLPDAEAPDSPYTRQNSDDMQAWSFWKTPDDDDCAFPPPFAFNVKIMNFLLHRWVAPDDGASLHHY